MPTQHSCGTNLIDASVLAFERARQATHSYRLKSELLKGQAQRVFSQCKDTASINFSKICKFKISHSNTLVHIATCGNSKGEQRMD